MKERVLNRDHTYLRTKDDIFFVVGGDIHTKKHIFGQPYYFPQKKIEEILDTKIQKSISIDGKGFCKLLDVIKPDEYGQFIKENFKDYYYSPPVWPLLMRVDRDKISRVLDPRKGRQDIMRKYGNQKDLPLIYLLGLIREFDKNLYCNTGITGSLLLHKDLSQLKKDVDLIIHGQENVLLSRDFSIEMCTENGRFSFLDGSKLSDHLDVKMGNFSGTREQLSRLSRKRWDTYFVDETKIDLTFSSDHELPLNSYDLSPTDERIIVGRIVNARNSYYLPTFLKVESKDGIEDVVITSRGYICLFQRFDNVQIIGKEFVNRKDGQKYIVVTGGEGSYIAKN